MKKVDTYQSQLCNFAAYSNSKKNLTFERHVFLTRAKQEGESIDFYVTDLKIKSKSCEFGTLEESLITDGTVCKIGTSQYCAP
ncbi:hypothetical protein HOLleu_37922 [Holothuria leucospilota]|uniref:Uncharacterized protein n=1 Tax=Holothuria leucospilota TaxID=206669 RepID=A0A9Q0YI05_HOLLE|nr:hypothetical protein HOLleu_37922 [Holothuria leucospilota]